MDVCEYCVPSALVVEITSAPESDSVGTDRIPQCMAFLVPLEELRVRFVNAVGRHGREWQDERTS